MPMRCSNKATRSRERIAEHEASRAGTLSHTPPPQAPEAPQRLTQGRDMAAGPGPAPDTRTLEGRSAPGLSDQPECVRKVIKRLAQPTKPDESGPVKRQP